MGRFFAATSGVHLTTVMDVKCNMGCNYAICDSGINQLHYDGQIKGMQAPDIKLFNKEPEGEKQRYVLCGSLCTTADILANFNTVELKNGDVLAFNRVGAYSIYEGMANFLSRELPGVVMVSDNGIVRVREEVPTDIFNTAGVNIK